MLLGHQCASTHPITDADVAKAVRIVKEGFAYVGLLEHWATSVCLFHATFREEQADGGNRRRLTMELRLTHPGPLRTKHAGDAARGSFTYDEKALRGFVDEADERVYKAASERFWADARRAGCAAARQSQTAEEGAAREDGSHDVKRVLLRNRVWSMPENHTVRPLRLLTRHSP